MKKQEIKSEHGPYQVMTSLF